MTEAGLIDRLQAALTTRALGREARWYMQVGSTNTEADRWADAGASHGAVVLAEAQSAGRGRLGRRWEAAAGMGLYLSVVLRPAVAPRDLPLVGFAGALAVVDALGGIGVRAGLKWPNDVVVGPRKIAGLLSEARFRGAEVGGVVLGIGANLGHEEGDLPEELREIATSARIEGAGPVDRPAFAAALLGALEGWLGRLEGEGPPGVLEAWRAASITLGREVVYAGEGGVVLRGVARDIDGDGALVLETGDGARHRITAGDIRLGR